MDTIFVGGGGLRDRAYNRRFQQMCGHYLVEAGRRARPPRAGRKGQVEENTGSAVIRRRLFVPRPEVQELCRASTPGCSTAGVAWAKAASAS